MGKLLNKMIQREKAELDQWESQRNASLSLPEGVTEILNIPYIEDKIPRHRMDLYRPTGNENILPVIIDVHGGGLLMGNKEMNRHFCAQLSALGFLVFSVEYQLVPDVMVYKQFADVSAAMDAIEGILDDWKGDRNHIYTVGDSAGAYLILYAIAMQSCSDLAKASEVKPSALPVKALGLISGMYYTRRADKIGLFLPNLLYGKGYKRHAFFPFTNPEHPDMLKKLPPCYLMTSKSDMLHQYTVDFARALEKNEVTYVLKDYPEDKELVHAFSVIHSETEKGMKANQEMVEFLRKY